MISETNGLLKLDDKEIDENQIVYWIIYMNAFWREMLLLMVCFEFDSFEMIYIGDKTAILETVLWFFWPFLCKSGLCIL